VGLTAKLGVATGALALLAGAWFVGRGLIEEDPAPSRARTEEPTITARQEPRLEGNPLSHAPAAESSAPSAARPASAAPDQAEATVPGDAAIAGRLEDLIAQIRRDVEPAAWSADPAPILEGKNGILILRAPPELADAVREYLEDRRLRSSAPPAPRGRLEQDPQKLREAHAEVLALLSRMAAQEGRLADLFQAIGEGRRADAEAVAAAVRAEEPDHPWAVVPAAQPAPAPAPTPPPGPARPAPIAHELMFRPAPLDSWVQTWPGPTLQRALREALNKANIQQLALRGAALRDVLERGSVTLRLEDAPVLRLLREIQIAPLVDGLADPSARAELAGIRVPRFEVVGRPLAHVLDRLLEALPQGFRFAISPHAIYLRKEGPPRNGPALYLDVKDLLGLPRTVPQQAVPIPPVYQEGAAGEAPRGPR
jgi:hypothetical protein